MARPQEKRISPSMAEADSKSMAADKVSLARTHDESTLFDVNEHGAIVAADAAQGWKRYVAESAVRSAAASGESFAADDVEAACGLSFDGNWVGGVFMRLHREGVIRRAGWRPSTKPSRAGSVVAVWVGGETHDQPA